MYVARTPLKAEDLDKLTYTHAVFKELLRLHLPTPLLVPRGGPVPCSVAARTP
ncbi:MAG: cytochrome P450 [Holophagales bacterium]|nr:cytochrome P450 [Holophagales bacterium]MYF05243.1 cytochrome P450 [Holophagales bacterium]MYJ26397.1 cytochrome P450 [Holophagales bacterium]